MNESSFFGNGSANLVPCTNNCDFQSLLTLIGNLFNFMLAVALPLGALVIAIGGLMIVLNPGDSGKREAAKKIIWSVVIGLVVMLAAYLIVNTILDYFVDPTLRGSINI